VQVRLGYNTLHQPKTTLALVSWPPLNDRNRPS
jgi:hypothetical protein